MKKFSLLAVLALFVLALTAVAFAGDDNAQSNKSADAPKVFDAPQNPGTAATCPVTGETFTITKETKHSEYKGKYVYFCCAGCKPQFDKEPEKYLGKK